MRKVLMAAAALAAATALQPAPAQAQRGAVAAGVAAGVLGGALIAGALSSRAYGYGYGYGYGYAPYYYGGPQVYYAPSYYAPAYVAPVYRPRRVYVEEPAQVVRVVRRERVCRDRQVPVYGRHGNVVAYRVTRACR